MSHRVCITVEADRRGWPRDEEAWTTAGPDRSWPPAIEAVEDFRVYLAGRGVVLGGLHVGTDDWVRDYARRYGP